MNLKNVLGSKCAQIIVEYILFFVITVAVIIAVFGGFSLEGNSMGIKAVFRQTVDRAIADLQKQKD